MPTLKLFLHSLYVECMFVWGAHTCHAHTHRVGECMWKTENSLQESVFSFYHVRGAWGSNSGCQAWQQLPLPTEAPRCLKNYFYLFILSLYKVPSVLQTGLELTMYSRLTLNSHQSPTVFSLKTLYFEASLDLQKSTEFLHTLLSAPPAVNI